MVELVREGTIQRYWLEQDLLYAKGGRISVPEGRAAETFNDGDS
jgi:hypothetical protein